MFTPESIVNPSGSLQAKKFIQTLYLDSELRHTRKTYGDVIRRYYRNQRKSVKNGYDSSTVAYIEKELIAFGFIDTDELSKLKNGKRLRSSRIGKKFVTWRKAAKLTKKWKSEGKTIGLVYGTFDPPHLNHARLLKQVKILGKCDILVAAFNNVEYVKQIKDKPGDRRPRVKQLNWKKEQLASLPQVTLVTTLPVTQSTSESYLQVYKDLGVNIAGFGEDKEGQNVRMENIRKVGAEPIMIPFLNDYSSTKMVGLLKDEKVQKETGYSFKKLQRRARFGEIRASLRRVFRV